MHRLSETFRGYLREFAFYIGNDTLNYFADNAEEFEYDEQLNKSDPLLAILFTIYLNNYSARKQGQTTSSPEHRAAGYLAGHCLPNYTIEPPLAPWELNTQHHANSVVGAIITFATAIGHGQLMPELLANVAYQAIIVEYGSFLEQVFAIFTNCIVLDDKGKVTNYVRAEWRASQYIRSYCDQDYQIVPPFEDWEMELV